MIDLDLNSEPIVERDESSIAADSDFQKKCDFYSFGSEEERGSVVNVESGKVIELAAVAGACAEEESKLVQCGVDAVKEGDLDDSNVLGFIKEEPVLLQESNAGIGSIKLESEKSGQSVANDNESDRGVELAAAACAEESKAVHCAFGAVREGNFGGHEESPRISNVYGIRTMGTNGAGTSEVLGDPPR